MEKKASFIITSYHTFLGAPTTWAKKAAWRTLNATLPKVPQYVKWLEKPITWNRQDHPDIVPKEYYALVVGAPKNV